MMNESGDRTKSEINHYVLTIRNIFSSRDKTHALQMQFTPLDFLTQSPRRLGAEPKQLDLKKTADEKKQGFRQKNRRNRLDLPSLLGDRGWIPWELLYCVLLHATSKDAVALNRFSSFKGGLFSLFLYKF